MSDSYDIFISYSSKDSHIVHDYAKYLEKLGYKVWYDVKGLYTGAQFSKEIVSAIVNSKLFLFFSSVNSNESVWTKGEVLTAQKYKKQILPVKIDDSDYDQSLMLVLLPLQYIECKSNKFDDTNEELRKAVVRFIGKPTSTSIHYGQQDYVKKRKGQKLSIAIAIITSLFFSFCMMYLSGEYWLNMSLALFTMFITASICILVSFYIVNHERNWNQRATIVNLFFLLGILFFLSYSITALGLCFISIDVFSLNSPSIICAGLAIFAFYELMSFKKKGYYLLWISAFLFSIGSYLWLNSMQFTIVLTIIACVCMLILTQLLRVKYNGASHWERMS